MRVRRTKFKSGDGDAEVTTLRGSGDGFTLVTISPGADGVEFAAADENGRPIPVVEETDEGGPAEER